MAKTDEILYLESDSEITQVIEKIKNLPGNSVLLVLPKNAQLAQSIVNFRLIKKETEKINKKIALVTSDRNAQNIASQIDIEVYKSIDDEKPIAKNKKDLPELDDSMALSGHKSIAEELQAAGVNVKRYDESEEVDLSDKPDEDKQIEKVELTDTDIEMEDEKNKKNSQKDKKKIRIPWLPLGLSALAFLGIIWWLVYIFPSANIFLSIESEPVTKIIPVSVDNNIDKTNKNAGKIAGQKIEAQVTHKVTVDATGQKEVGTKAKGTIQVRNRLGTAITVDAGSRFSSGGMVFVSTKTVSIPAGKASLNETGNVVVTPGTTNATVEAEKPGADHNIPASEFTIISLPESQQDKVTGLSETAMTGGESRTITVISKDDLTKAEEKIKGEVEDDLETKIQEQAKELTILAGTIEIIIENPQTNFKVGEEVENFTMEAVAKGRTIGFLAGDYQETIFLLAQNELPEGKELVAAQSDSIETTIEEKKFADGILSLKATLRSEMVNKIDKEAIKNQIAGLRATEAENFLKSQDDFIDVRVELRPSYKAHLPKSPKKIEVFLVRD